MAAEKRIPRVRIHEDNFAEEIKNPQYPEELLEYPEGPGDYFIEVVDTKNKTIALFFQICPFERDDFNDVLEYAKYYDSLGTRHEEVDSDADANINYSIFYLASEGIICYGRLKYPLGLSDEDRNFYEGWFPFGLLGEDHRILSLGGKENYSDDLIDFINDALVFVNNMKTEEKDLDLLQYFQWEPGIYPFCIINLGIKILTGIADNYFTKNNIDLFIDAVIGTEETEIITFLLDYKDKHFPVDGDSMQFTSDSLNS